MNAIQGVANHSCFVNSLLPRQGRHSAVGFVATLTNTLPKTAADTFPLGNAPVPFSVWPDLNDFWHMAKLDRLLPAGTLFPVDMKISRVDSALHIGSSAPAHDGRSHVQLGAF